MLQRSLNFNQLGVCLKDANGYQISHIIVNGYLAGKILFQVFSNGNNYTVHKATIKIDRYFNPYFTYKQAKYLIPLN